MIPSIGRTVHYVLASGRNAGQHRPAVIVCVLDKRAKETSQVQLQVFTDGANDELPSVMHVESVTRDQMARAGNTWHEPEEIAAARARSERAQEKKPAVH